ncbi:MAG: hypothetical protein ABI606_14850 [Rhodoferax sp.]
MSLGRPDDLAGVLRVAPGQARPHNLVSSRRDWAAFLTRGVSAASLPSRLGSLFSLCAHAHRLCADMAVTAALGRSKSSGLSAAQDLQQETLREHVRRIGLDWPEQLAFGLASEQARQQAHAALQQCPLFASVASNRSDGQLDEPCPGLQQWLGTHLLGMPTQAWLSQWEQDPTAWLRAWTEDSPGWLAGLLRQARPLADRAAPAAPFLRVHTSEAGLRVLADCLVRQPGFTRQPLWRGQCAETGPWTRLRQATPEVINTPWLRLGSRLAELVRLALPDEPGRSGASWLTIGSMATARREGLAWVEMARGLLVHHVQLDGPGDDARVASCQVLAPTEWNFHPQGAVAQALEQLTTPSMSGVCREVDLLFSAYDPCVKHEILTEDCHA